MEGLKHCLNLVNGYARAAVQDAKMTLPICHGAVHIFDPVALIQSISQFKGVQAN